MSYEVRHNEADSRFETEVEGQTAFAEYDLEPGAIVFTHTIVPDELSGRGIAQALVRTALEYARQQKLAVVPQCAYVAAFIRRHPEYEKLVRRS